MMRDYRNFESYLNELAGDIYPQPVDEGHTTMAQNTIDAWIAGLVPCNSVLDVGCGRAFTQPMFEALKIKYTGVTLGVDYVVAQHEGRNVHNYDFSFLPYKDNSFHLVFARHALEHSPFPILTLFEWHRVASNWLCLVIPDPAHYGCMSPNHYSMMNSELILFLLERSGWHVIWTGNDGGGTEIRFMCEKRNRILERLRRVRIVIEDETKDKEEDKDES